MFRKTMASVLSAAFLLTGCMGDREYQLRRQQLLNQANHPATYDLFTVDGPFKIEIGENGKAKVAVPGQPFREIPIPDGVRTQADLVKHLAGIGAVTAAGWKALDNVNRETTRTTTTTVTGGAQ